MGSRSPETAVPHARSASVSAAKGRSGSRPWPVSVAESRKYAAAGRRKRAVEPLSPQSRTAVRTASSRAPTRTAWPSNETAKPIAARQSRVARVSPQSAEARMAVSPAQKAAAMHLRCRSDLEGGTATVPASLPGVMVMSIVLPPYAKVFAVSARSSSKGIRRRMQRPTPLQRTSVMLSPLRFLSSSSVSTSEAGG